jgi:hypothetical protein
VNRSNSQFTSDDSVEIDEEYPYRPQPPLIDVSEDVVQTFLSRPLQIFDVRAVIAALCLVLFFAGINLVICPLMDMFFGGPPAWYVLPMFVLAGAVLAQGGLLSACLVFLDGRLWLRAAICWTVGLVLWSCWALGLTVASSFGSWGPVGDELRVGTLSLPLAVLAIQLPLWFARTYLGWRLIAQQPGTLVSQPFSIRDYFVGTAVAAISITFARLARPASWPVENYWPGWAIVFCVLAGGSLLANLPAMFFIFRVPNAWLGFALLSLYAFMMASLIILLIAIDPSVGMLEIAALMTLLMSVAAFLGLGFAVARGCGYVLETRRCPRAYL